MAIAFDAEYLITRSSEQRVWILTNPSRFSTSAALLSLPAAHPKVFRQADQIPFVSGALPSEDDPWSFDSSENVLDVPRPILKRPSAIFRRREPEPVNEDDEAQQVRCLPLVRFVRRLFGRAWKGYKRVGLCRLGVPIHHRTRFPPDGAELDTYEDSKTGGRLYKFPDSSVDEEANRTGCKRTDRRVRFAEPLPHFTPSSGSRKKRTKRGGARHKTLIVTNDFSILYVNHKFPRKKTLLSA